MKRIVGLLLMLCLMAACSDPDQGPPLGTFAAITKTETDKPFDIVPPSSRSPAPFTFTSSDGKVATISGSLVTITGPGVSTITASQASIGGYGPTSASTTLTVTAVPCDAGSSRVAGVCTVIPTCILPAKVDSNNKCVAPATGAAMVTVNALAWMGVSDANVNSWDKARDFCAGSIIDGFPQWRLPTEAELKALFDSKAIDGHNWALGNTWSSTMGTTASSASHIAVDLVTGASVERVDTAHSYVSCVH